MNLIYILSFSDCLVIVAFYIDILHMAILHVCFQSVVECLETLNLGHNNITNEGIHYLKEGLLKNKSLIRLGLQGTKVLCEGKVFSFLTEF